MKNFAGINFRESPILENFAGINFRESTFSGVKKGIYFREFGQNSRNSRNFLPAKISSLKVCKIFWSYHTKKLHFELFEIDSLWEPAQFRNKKLRLVFLLPLWVTFFLRDGSNNWKGAEIAKMAKDMWQWHPPTSSPP